MKHDGSWLLRPHEVFPNRRMSLKLGVGLSEEGSFGFGFVLGFDHRVEVVGRRECGNQFYRFPRGV
jgi:hypothetical protein